MPGFNMAVRPTSDATESFSELESGEEEEDEVQEFDADGSQADRGDDDEDEDDEDDEDEGEGDEDDDSDDEDDEDDEDDDDEDEENDDEDETVGQNDDSATFLVPSTTVPKRSILVTQKKTVANGASPKSKSFLEDEIIICDGENTNGASNSSCSNEGTFNPKAGASSNNSNSGFDPLEFGEKDPLELENQTDDNASADLMSLDEEDSKNAADCIVEAGDKEGAAVPVIKINRATKIGESQWKIKRKSESEILEREETLPAKRSRASRQVVSYAEVEEDELPVRKGRGRIPQQPLATSKKLPAALKLPAKQPLKTPPRPPGRPPLKVSPQSAKQSTSKKPLLTSRQIAAQAKQSPAVAKPNQKSKGQQALLPPTPVSLKKDKLLLAVPGKRGRRKRKDSEDSFEILPFKRRQFRSADLEGDEAKDEMMIRSSTPEPSAVSSSCDESNASSLPNSRRSSRWPSPDKKETVEKQPSRRGRPKAVESESPTRGSAKNKSQEKLKNSSKRQLKTPKSSPLKTPKTSGSDKAKGGGSQKRQVIKPEDVKTVKIKKELLEKSQDKSRSTRSSTDKSETENRRKDSVIDVDDDSNISGKKLEESSPSKRGRPRKSEYPFLYTAESTLNFTETSNSFSETPKTRRARYSENGRSDYFLYPDETNSSFGDSFMFGDDFDDDYFEGEKSKGKKFTRRLGPCKISDEGFPRLTADELESARETGWQCKVCGRKMANQWSLDTHFTTVHGMRTFTCDICHKAFKRKDHLINHKRSIHLVRTKACLYCDLTFRRKTELVSHMKLKHPKSVISTTNVKPGDQVYMEDESPKKRGRKAKYVDENGTPLSPEDRRALKEQKKLERKLEKRMKKSLDDSFDSVTGKKKRGRPKKVCFEDKNAHRRCPDCRQVFIKACQVPAHRRSWHLEHLCPFCHRLYAGSERLESHMEEHRIMQEDGTVVFACTYCPGKFSKEACLSKHARDYHLEEHCLGCGSCIRGSLLMQTHVLEHHPPEKIERDVLILGYDSPDTFYQCSLCPRSFYECIDAEHHFLTKHVVQGNCRRALGVRPPKTWWPWAQLYPQLDIYADYRIFRKEIYLASEKHRKEQMLDFQDEFNSFTAEHIHNRGIVSRKSIPPEPTSVLYEDEIEDIIYQCQLCKDLFVDNDLLEEHLGHYHMATCFDFPELLDLSNEPLFKLPESRDETSTPNEPNASEDVDSEGIPNDKNSCSDADKNAPDTVLNSELNPESISTPDQSAPSTIQTEKPTLPPELLTVGETSDSDTNGVTCSDEKQMNLIESENSSNLQDNKKIEAVVPDMLDDKAINTADAHVGNSGGANSPMEVDDDKIQSEVPKDLGNKIEEPMEVDINQQNLKSRAEQVVQGGIEAEQSRISSESLNAQQNHSSTCTNMNQTVSCLDDANRSLPAEKVQSELEVESTNHENPTNEEIHSEINIPVAILEKEPQKLDQKLLSNQKEEKSESTSGLASPVKEDLETQSSICQDGIDHSSNQQVHTMCKNQDMFPESKMEIDPMLSNDIGKNSNFSSELGSQEDTSQSLTVKTKIIAESDPKAEALSLSINEIEIEKESLLTPALSENKIEMEQESGLAPPLSENKIEMEQESGLAPPLSKNQIEIEQESRLTPPLSKNKIEMEQELALTPLSENQIEIEQESGLAPPLSENKSEIEQESGLAPPLSENKIEMEQESALTPLVSEDKIEMELELGLTPPLSENKSEMEQESGLTSPLCENKMEAEPIKEIINTQQESIPTEVDSLVDNIEIEPEPSTIEIDPTQDKVDPTSIVTEPTLDNVETEPKRELLVDKVETALASISNEAEPLICASDSTPTKTTQVPVQNNGEDKVENEETLISPDSVLSSIAAFSANSRGEAEENVLSDPHGCNNKENSQESTSNNLTLVCELHDHDPSSSPHLNEVVKKHSDSNSLEENESPVESNNVTPSVPETETPRSYSHDAIIKNADSALESCQSQIVKDNIEKVNNSSSGKTQLENDMSKSQNIDQPNTNGISTQV